MTGSHRGSHRDRAGREPTEPGDTDLDSAGRGTTNESYVADIAASRGELDPDAADERDPNSYDADIAAATGQPVDDDSAADRLFGSREV